MSNNKFDDEDYSNYNGQTKCFNSLLLRNEHEFYKEEDDVAHKIINVRKSKIRNSNDWEILENNKVVLILKGVRFTTAEKKFFGTPDGMQFIINGYKNGWNSVLKFKNELKNILK